MHTLSAERESVIESAETVSVLVDPPVTSDLVAKLTSLWAKVTNEGGSVGFVSPITEEEVRPHTVAILARVIEGADTLVALTEAGQIVAWCVLSANDTPPREHWRNVRHVQVDPDSQGSGIGGKLLAAAETVAREELKLDALSLKVRTGTGAEQFYRRHGYVEVGRIPDAVKVGPEDYRDDIIMWRRLL